MRVCTACARRTDEAGQFCPACGGPLRDEAARSYDDPSASAASLVGVTIDGQFTLQAMIGGGAFGTVYRGMQVGLDRSVAVKVPTHAIAADPVMAKRFAREARAAARVAHPGVVQIYAVGELPDKRPYLAMQLVEGEPLDRCLEQGPLAPARALRIARAIASALGETHAQAVVHRDLKPSNIIWRVDRNGDDRVVLVDFGIAACKFASAVDATKLTAGGLIGTPHYMSPEQAHGEAVDARADLYGLGCVLFELLTNQPPFDGSAVEVMLAHLGRLPPVPSDLEADIPEAVDRLVGALLEKKPDDRPDSADDVVAMIDRILRDIERRPAAARSARLSAPAKKKKTLATRRELPDGTLLPARIAKPRRWLPAIVVLAIVLVGGAGFAAFRFGLGRGAGSVSAPGSAASAGTRVVHDDDGETLMRVSLPDPVIATREAELEMKIVNKLGQPVVADQVVVTVTDPSGHARGTAAQPFDAPAGRYQLRYTFPDAGRYVVRIFPPSGPDSAFEIQIDVTEAP